MDIAPMALTIIEACDATRTGKTKIYEEIKAGRLRAHKRGRTTLILPEDLREWVASLPAIEPRRVA
jgi:excisionase family DNA binding protein